MEVGDQVLTVCVNTVKTVREIDSFYCSSTRNLDLLSKATNFLGPLDEFFVKRLTIFLPTNNFYRFFFKQPTNFTVRFSVSGKETPTVPFLNTDIFHGYVQHCVYTVYSALINIFGFQKGCLPKYFHPQMHYFFEDSYFLEFKLFQILLLFQTIKMSSLFAFPQYFAVIHLCCYLLTGSTHLHSAARVGVEFTRRTRELFTTE